MKKLIPCWILIAILFGAVSLMAAGNNLLWELNGTTVCENTDDQQQPQAVADAFGGVIVAWQNYRRGEDIDIYAQRLDRQGHTIWSDDGLPICSSSNDQQGVQMARDGDGNAYLIWSDYRRNEDFDIYVQKINANGTRLWSDEGVAVCRAPSNQVSPQIVADGLGGAVVVWADSRNEGGTDIFAQHVDPNGASVWSADGVPVCAADDRQVSPQIVSDGAEGVIIAWLDRRGGVDMDLYGQRLDPSGASVWDPDGIVICAEAENRRGHRVMPDGSGGAILAWEDSRSGQWDIYAQRIDAGGTGLWQMGGVPVCDLMGNQTGIAMVADGSWGVVVAWTDGRRGQEDIYAQRIDANGNMIWEGGGAPVCAQEHRQGEAQLIGDGSGGAIVAWQDYRSGSRHQVFAQRVNAYGRTLRPAGGTPVCEASSNQTEPRIVGDGSGGAVVIWLDQRGEDADIFAQRVNFNPAPQIQSVGDLPNDQGRNVLILWQPSYFDNAESRLVTSYSIWRKCLPGSNVELVGIEWDGVVPKDDVRRVYRHIERGTDSGEIASECWEWLGSVTAAQHPQYGFIALTPKDSSSEDAAQCWFTVSAHTSEPFELWESAPRTGYSVDDIPPGRTQLKAVDVDGQTGAFELIWEKVSNGIDGSPENGPLKYHIHCDILSNFTPSPENLVWTTPDLSFGHTDMRILDSMSGVYYLVIATDGSDNRSAPSNRLGGLKLSLNKER